MKPILKFGEKGWFETRDGHRVFAFNFGEGRFPIVGVVKDGSRLAFTECGHYRLDLQETDCDLVRHLPDCTSWDWIEPPKVDEYRPFASAEEFLPFADNWVRAKSDACLARVNAIGKNYVIIAHSAPTFQSAFERYEFLDGTPFGVRKS